MNEPIIEHKHRQPRPRQDTTISLLEAKLVKGEREAQSLLNQLEEAMVRCGYTRDGVYNSRLAGWSDRGQRGTVICWEDGKILLGRGLIKNPKTGKAVQPYKYNQPVSVKGMRAQDLIRVASNLAPFLDALENNARHQVEAMARAVETIRGMRDRIEADPRPSETPAQMSPDPDAEPPQE